MKYFVTNLKDKTFAGPRNLTCKLQNTKLVGVGVPIAMAGLAGSTTADFIMREIIR